MASIVLFNEAESGFAVGCTQFALKNIIFNTYLPIFVSYVLAISFIYLLNLFFRFPVFFSSFR